MSNLLISEPPLQVLPSLANELKSSDKAIIIQQIHYWLNKSTNIRDGNKWIYNSASDWQKQFPWLSEKTVQRYLKDLENRGLLITGNYNKAKFDRTKWYRIDYDALDNLGRALGPTVPTIGTDSTNPKGPTGPTNTNRLPENTTETNKTLLSGKPDPVKGSQIDYDIFFKWFNEQTGRHFENIESNRRKVNGRLNDGYTKSDIEKVVTFQSKKWKGTDQKEYLRPSTLFRPSNFENYLNDANEYYNQNPTTKEDLFRQ